MLLIKRRLSIRVEVTHLCATHAINDTYNLSLTTKLRFYKPNYHNFLVPVRKARLKDHKMTTEE